MFCFTVGPFLFDQLILKLENQKLSHRVTSFSGDLSRDFHAVCPAFFYRATAFTFLCADREEFP